MKYIFFAFMILLSNVLIASESPIIIRSAKPSDFAGIKMLFQAVAKQGGGIARTYDEITDDYIKKNLDNSLKKGKSYVAEINGTIVGEIHTYRLDPKVFAHILGELTIAVHPTFQSKGIGKKLFLTLLDEVKAHEPSILRIELVARETNTKAINFYKSIGFVQEGRLEKRICNNSGALEADIPMAWFNPNYHD